MEEPKFDFYDKTQLKIYNLNESMQYQLKMLDSLDAYTRLHCENVASITCRLCDYLHLPAAFTKYATTCAYLHDVGKQFVPSSILQKPGKLTEEEYEIMKSHTTIGYEICMRDLKLREFAAGAYYHHEALNGTGYPQGLKKENIPYEAQIIRVADEFDAIVSKRQYKSHVGISDTIKILIENSNPVSNADALSALVEDSKPGKGEKYGKNNKKVVKCLLKVILDDTAFEIYAKTNYVKTLNVDLKRLKQILAYKKEYLKAKTDKNRSYYLSGMEMIMRKGETVDNIESVYSDYLNTIEKIAKQIKTLNNECKIIKKLKV